MVYNATPSFGTNSLSLVVPKMHDVEGLLNKLQTDKSPFLHHFVNGLDDPRVPE